MLASSLQMLLGIILYCSICTWFLQGVRAVIAESFERIHRSNLVGMGVIPLQFLEGENTEKLGITGKELFSVEIPQDLKPGQNLTVKVCCCLV